MTQSHPSPSENRSHLPVDVNKVLIVLNDARPDAIEDSTLLETYLLGQGIDATRIPNPNGRENPMPNGSIDGYDLVVSLGGDGTLLQAARLVGSSGIPIVGISYGHLGFLTCSEPKELFHTLL